MVQGWSFESLHHVILVMSVVLQGITPDTNDLASNRSLLLLSSFLGSTGSMKDEDNALDSVCEAELFDRMSVPQDQHNPSLLPLYPRQGNFRKAFLTDLHVSDSLKDIRASDRRVTEGLSHLRC